jgi:uncharacterized membrane protein
MSLLILGLVLFLGTHSLRMFADGWRTTTRARMGEGAFKGVYTLLSLAGFALICYGYGLARQSPVVLWQPPVAMRHVAALLTLVAFIFLAASGVPRNSIKSKLKHPMVLGTKVWAFAHLLSNGNLADVVLFGTFLVWAVLNFRAARGRDRAQGITYAAGTASGTAITVVVGVVLWVVFALWLHGMLIGVRPFG